MEPKCPVCKSSDVHVWEDKTLEYEVEDLDTEDDEL